MLAPTDDQLAQLAIALEAIQHRTGCWTTPARLLALDRLSPATLDSALTTGTVPWRHLGDGNPYHLLELAACDPATTAAVALMVHGWAFPPEDPDSWFGRPSRHPGRLRARTVTVVSAAGHHCSAIRLQHRDVIVDHGQGEGPLVRALLGVFDPQEGRGAPVATRPGRRPADCRRDHHFGRP